MASWLSHLLDKLDMNLGKANQYKFESFIMVKDREWSRIDTMLA